MEWQGGPANHLRWLFSHWKKNPSGGGGSFPLTRFTRPSTSTTTRTPSASSPLMMWRRYKAWKHQGEVHVSDNQKKKEHYHIPVGMISVYIGIYLWLFCLRSLAHIYDCFVYFFDHCICSFHCLCHFFPEDVILLTHTCTSYSYSFSFFLEIT